jgi:hypothetical protein
VKTENVKTDDFDRNIIYPPEKRTVTKVRESAHHHFPKLPHPKRICLNAANLGTVHF